MNEETSARLALRELVDSDVPGLDPAKVIAGAKKRRSRNLAMAAVASVAVASVAVGAFQTVGAGGGEPQVAGFGAPSSVVSATPSAKPKSSASPPHQGNVVPSTQFSRLLPKPRSSWTAGGQIGAQPIGTITAGGQVELGANHRFETKGTQWCITKAGESPGGPNEPFPCQDTVGNANIGDGRTPGIAWSTDANGHRVVLSVFRGDARRVIYTDGDKFYEAKLYRLAAVPGWMMSVATYEQPEADNMQLGDAYVFAYDAAGKVTAQFPSAKDGGPQTDPLR